MTRPVLTLLTDFGTQDSYVAEMKAVLLAELPDCQLVDVTHQIPPQDVRAGAIVLERAVRAFAPGTVHVAVVDPGVGSGRRILAVEIAGQIVLCPDNGLITWAWRRLGGGAAHELTWRPAGAPISPTFHGRDLFAVAAGRIARGEPLADFCNPIADPVLLDLAPATLGGPVRILHVDHFGNATTNLPAEALEGARAVTVAVGDRRIVGLVGTYADVSTGESLALVGSSGLLEIAVRDGSAARTLGLKIGDSVKVNVEVSTITSITPAPALTSASATERLRQLDRRYVWHPFTPMKLWAESEPLVITAAGGMELIDSDGRRYLDGVSSLWCNVHGHRVPEIDAAVTAQLAKVAHTTMLGLASEPAILLAERLMRLVPANLRKIFYSDSGATATEVAFKLAVQYWHNVGRPRKTGFVGFAEAYHGDTFGAMSVGRTPAFHKPYFPLLFPVHFAPTPYVYRSQTPNDPEAVKQHCLAALEAILRQHADTLAAVCIEPIVQGAAGMIVHPTCFLAEVRRLTKQYDVLLIADEVAVGFGRTGKFFACEHEQIEPDLMCVAKGITGGYLPLAATFATQPIFDAFLGEPWERRTFYHGHTYTGNPLACAAALASLDLFEKNDVVNGVATKSNQLAEMLGKLAALPHVGDIRQRGFMVGVELVEDKATRKPFDPRRRIGAAVCERIRAHGVILRPLGDVIVLMPPLAMGVEDLRRIVKAVRAEVGTL